MYCSMQRRILNAVPFGMQKPDLRVVFRFQVATIRVRTRVIDTVYCTTAVRGDGHIPIVYITH
jgi:hypothetical protein